MNRRLTLALSVLAVLLLSAGFVAGIVVGSRVHAGDLRAETLPPAAAAAAAPASEPAQRSAPATAAVAIGQDFTRIAAQAVKGVANISSLQVVRAPNSPFADDPFFRYFFGDNDSPFGTRDRRSLSLGSGVIIASDGYLITNSHVVGENVRELTITLPDKREIKGKLIGQDPTTDIALVKIAVTGLPAVPWGDSGQLKVGEWVLAIGSPYQLNQTVTAGIVSATGRTGLGFANYEDFIQTDAAINRGNSGGALINSRGELVGINTGIFSESGGYQGIGFAVPSNLARRVVSDLMNYGEVHRGSIGYLYVEKVPAEFAREAGLQTTNGAVVTKLMRSSPAYLAGLQPGDVILAFNGQPVEDPGHLMKMIADAKIGSTATLKVQREGRSVEVKVPVMSTGRK